MTIRQVQSREKRKYNQSVNHVVQSWEWGEFRKKTGVKVIRLGKFDQDKLVQGYQLTLHSLPFGGLQIGYLPKTQFPDKSLIQALEKIGKNENCVFIKLEPRVTINDPQSQLSSPKLVPSSQPLFTKHNFLIDLTLLEKDLLREIKPKSRYNLRLAQRKGVKVEEKSDPQSFETYLKLYFDTCQRQGYFGHDRKYHQLMWETLKPTGMAHLLIGSYQGEPLVAWMLLKFKDTLYYPYGGSSVEHRNLMTSNLVCWKAIKLGKKLRCRTFDLWGALGPEADQSHPWYGWHRFKAGYGGKLVEYLGSFDLVLKPGIYRWFKLVNQVRWKCLKVKSSLRSKS